MSKRAEPAADTLRDFSGLSREETIARLRAMADGLSLAERFVLLHRLGIYRGKESLSGDGSSLAETAALRRALPALLRQHSVRRLLDIPCGDFHWMRTVELGSVEYLGADIVPEIVERNRELFGAEHRIFVTLDLTRDPLPPADLVVCRDLLVHLSLGDIGLAIRNVVRSGSRLLLASHFTDCAINEEISSGYFRPINLCHPPFGFPRPITVIDERSRMDETAYPDRSMALWSISELPSITVRAGDDREPTT